MLGHGPGPYPPPPSHYGLAAAPPPPHHVLANGPHGYVNHGAYGQPNYPTIPIQYAPNHNKLENKHDGAPSSSGVEKGGHDGPYGHKSQSWEQQAPPPPESAQEKHRGTPDRRTPGRSPGLGDASAHHMSGPNGMGQGMVPSIAPAPYPGSHPLYSQPMYNMSGHGPPPPPYIASNNQPNIPFNGGYPVEAKKMRLGEPESLGGGDPNRGGPPQSMMESNFQVPSGMSSAARHGPFNGNMPAQQQQQTSASMAPHNVAQASPMRMPPMSGEAWDQSASHSNPNLMANQQQVHPPSAPSTPTLGSQGVKSPNSETDKSGKKKRKRCGSCPGCLRKDNCGECGPCKSVRSHQICKMRKCDQLKTKKEKVREVG